MTKQTSEVTYYNGKPIDIDASKHHELPSGLYVVNGKPHLLHHGDRVDGTIIVKKTTYEKKHGELK